MPIDDGRHKIIEEGVLEDVFVKDGHILKMVSADEPGEAKSVIKLEL